VIKFITSPDLCAHLTVWCELNQSVVNHAINEWRRRLSVCVDAEGGHLEHYFIVIISIKIVHEVHTKGSKHNMNKKVMKYTKTQCKKKTKYTVYERLEQIAEINTLISFL